jgi:hypothetical protein
LFPQTDLRERNLGVYVLRDETLTGSGSIVAEYVFTKYSNNVIPPEDPTRGGFSTGSCSISGAGSFSFQPYEVVLGTFPNYSWSIGWEITVTDAVGGTTTDDSGTTYNITAKTYIDDQSTGEWEASIDAQLCLEVTDPTTPSGTGSNAVNFMPDPPHGRQYRLFYRRKNGGNYSIEASIGGLTVSRSGTFTNSNEIGIPDQIISTVDAFAAQQADDTPFSIAGQISGTWRSAIIATEISASGDHGEAYANNTEGVKVIAECLADAIGDSGSAYATRTVAVPLTYSLDAQFRAMEQGYTTTLSLDYERAGQTVTESATDVFTDSSRTYRSEASEVWVATGTPETGITKEDEDEYEHPSNWGAISLAIKSTSATSADEPSSDLQVLLKDKTMNALTIATPERSANLTGVDTALAGSPWGVQRSYTGNTPAWQGLMGWRYLEVVIAETGGASAGAAVTIKIGSKEWTKDKDGNALTAPGSGNSANWKIDLCSPSSETAVTDTCDTTYPYDGDWSALGGDEDDYYRTGTGPYSGVNRATTIRIEVGSSRTFTITTIKGFRPIADTIYVTNLPTHNAWVEQRPDTIVSEADTTTKHKVRQCYEVDLDGRLISAEWSDTEWDTTIGGATQVYTHSVYQRSIEWLADRINAGILCPGWTASIAAVVPGTGASSWYNREREMHGILGGGWWWRAPTLVSLGGWEPGIDATQYTQALEGLTLPWQGGFTRLVNCPGGVGDVFGHAGTSGTGVLTLKGAKILRTQGVGLSLLNNGLPDSTSTLTLTQSAVVKGDGLTSPKGYAQTGQPFANGNGGNVNLDFDGGTPGTYDAKARKRRHFRSKPQTGTSGGAVCLANSEANEFARAFITSGDLYIGYSEFPVAQGWVDIDTGINCDYVFIAWQRYIETRALLIAYEASGVIYRSTTINFGRTVSVATTIFSSGAKPAMCLDDAGNEIYFCRKSTGALATKVYDPQGNVVIAETNIVASGVDNEPIGCEFRDGWIVVMYSASGVLTTRKSQNMTTYS